MKSPNEVTPDSSASPNGGAAVVSEPDRRGRDLVVMTRWFGVLLVWLFGLAIAGGTVRITGSGMSIPDWPIIYYGEGKTRGSILPPFSADKWQVVYNTYHRDFLKLTDKTADGWISMERFQREFWTEYTHRAFAKTFSLLFLVVIVQTFRKPVVRQRIGKLLVGSIVVLVLQITLGGVVVRNHTPVTYVATHLCGAFIFISMVAWMAMKLTLPVDHQRPPKAPYLTRLAWAAVFACFLQIFFGGIVAKSHAAKLQYYATWPKMGDTWVPPGSALWQTTFNPPIRNVVENPVFIQFVHRWWAFVVATLVVWLVVALLMKPLTQGGRWAARGIFTVLLLQIVLGVIAILKMVPILIGILHLATGLVLFELLVVLAFEVRHNNGIAALEKRAVEEAEKRVLEAQPA